MGLYCSHENSLIDLGCGESILYHHAFLLLKYFDIQVDTKV